MSVTVDEVSHSVSVVIPEIIHGTNFRTDNRYPYCQFVITAACVPDLVWRDLGYHANVTMNTGRTEWRPVTAQSEEQQMELKYVLPATDPATLLVSIGLRYGVVSPYGEIVPVNYGCAKVLLSRVVGRS